MKYRYSLPALLRHRLPSRIFSAVSVLFAFGFQQNDLAPLGNDHEVGVMVDETVDRETTAALQIAGPESNAFEVGNSVDDFFLKRIDFAFADVQRLD